MKIYYFLLLYLLILYIVKLYKNTIDKRTFILLSAIALFVIIGLRNYSVGTDTINYERMYYISWEYVEHFIKSSISLNSEALFWISANLIRVTGASSRVYFIFVSFVIVLSMSFFIQIYSKSAFLSFWLYVTMGLFALSMSGLRQMLALSITLFMYRFLIDGKFIKYLIVIVLACFFHFSAIVLIPFYFLRKVNLTSKNRPIVLLSTVALSFLLKDIVLEKVFSFNFVIGYNDYVGRLNISITNPLVVILAIGIPLVSTFIYSKSKDDNHNNQVFNIFYLMSCINIVILIFSLNLDIISRVSYYFYVSYIVILPNAISSIKDQNLKAATTIAMLVVSFAHFIISTPGSNLNVVPYLFLWQ